MKIKKRVYERDGMTVIWDMPKCIHSEHCWRELGSVFRRNERPWIYLEGAKSEDIRAQIDRCPSGALSYRVENTNENKEAMKITITENGPALLNGNCTITYKDGTTETREGNTALCRCGASGNKPFCDGSHKSSDFKG